MRRLDRALEVTQVALVPLAGGGLFALAAVTVGPELARGALALVAVGLLATAAEAARPRFLRLAPRERAARRPGRRRRALIAGLSLALLCALVWYAVPRPLTLLAKEDLHAAFEEDGSHLEAIRGYVDDSGEGRWTIAEAIAEDVPVPVITAALYARFASRQDESFAAKITAALRNEFGGHAVRTE